MITARQASAVWPVLAAAVLSTVVGGLVGASPLASLLLASLLGLAALVVGVLTRPVWVFRGALALLMLIPYSGLPFSSAVHPGVIALLALALATTAGLAFRQRLVLGGLDLAVALVLGGMCLSVVSGAEPASRLFPILLGWGSAFLAGRAVAMHEPREVLRSLTIAGAIALPFALVEFAVGNPFTRVFAYSVSAVNGIGVAQERFGFDRLQGAFGQSIPYAMVLSVCAVAAGILWMTRSQDRGRWVSHLPLVVAIGLVAAQAGSLARTGWLMLALVAATVVAFNARTVFRRRNLVFVAVALGLVGVTLSTGATRTLILGSGATLAQKDELARSAKYRTTLRERAVQPGYIKPFGNEARQLGPNGSVSIDNAYIVLGWSWGFLPLIGLAMIFVLIVVNGIRARSDLTSLALHGLGFALMVALASVAMFGQQQIFVWLIIGVLAGLGATRNQGAAVASAIASRRPRDRQERDRATAGTVTHSGGHP